MSCLQTHKTALFMIIGVSFYWAAHIYSVSGLIIFLNAARWRLYRGYYKQKCDISHSSRCLLSMTSNSYRKLRWIATATKTMKGDENHRCDAQQRPFKTHHFAKLYSRCDWCVYSRTSFYSQFVLTFFFAVVHTVHQNGVYSYLLFFCKHIARRLF